MVRIAKKLEEKMMNKFYSLFMPFFGSIIVSYLLYRRLIKIRVPREILPITSNILLSIYVLLGVTSSIMCIILSYNVYKDIKKVKNNPNKIILKISELMAHPKNPLNFWINSMIALDIYIKNKIPRYNPSMSYLDIIFIIVGKYANKHKKTITRVLLTLLIGCQSIVLASFFVDVIIYHKFLYFYKTLCLLIIPLIIKYIFYSFMVFINANLATLDEMLIIKVMLRTEYDKKPSSVENLTMVSVEEWYEICSNTAEEYVAINMLKVEYINDNLEDDHQVTLNMCLDSMNDFFVIKTFLNYYNIKKSKLVFFDLCRYIIYTISWNYILYLHFFERMS